MGGVHGTRWWILCLVAHGLFASVAGTLWTVRATSDWLETRRIQSGQRVVAVVVATGAVAGNHQDVTVEYRDDTDRTHRLDLRFPLGIGTSTRVGHHTAVAYDPQSPERAEMAGSPRHHWQDVAAAAGSTLLATGLWLRRLLRRRGSRSDARHDGAVLSPPTAPRPVEPVADDGSADEPGASGGGRRRNRGALAVIAVLLIYGGRAAELAVRVHPIQEVSFPALPPDVVKPTSTVKLPGIISAPPPEAGPLVTPDTARAVFEAMWPLRDRALAARDTTTLRAIETGAALERDQYRMELGTAPDRPFPGGALPSAYRTYTPRQAQWPIHFMAQAATRSADAGWAEVVIFVRELPESPWQIALVTGSSFPDGERVIVDPPIVDAEGYNVVPATPWIDPRDVAPALARYWTSWLETGRPPDSGPAFADGFWTSELLPKVANRQDQTDVNGLVRHRTYSDSRPRDNEIWSFGVYGARMVCTTMTHTDTWAGPAHQDGHRRKWGPGLEPGVYRSVTAQVLRPPCFYVPTAPGPIAVIGADKTFTEFHGTPK